MLHHNMPFSLPVIVGRCFTDSQREDRTVDAWIGSEIDPLILDRRRLPNGQIMEYWITVQNDMPVVIAYWSGMPVGLGDGDSYEVGFAALIPISLSLVIS